MAVYNQYGQRVCGACGQGVDRTDHFVFIEEGTYCREMILEQYATIGDFIRDLFDPLYEGE